MSRYSTETIPVLTVQFRTMEGIADRAARSVVQDDALTAVAAAGRLVALAEPWRRACARLRGDYEGAKDPKYVVNALFGALGRRCRGSAVIHDEPARKSA